VPRFVDPQDRTGELLAELAAVYADVDRLQAGSSCPASTECCRFGITGREPYVTSIELAAVRKAIGARGGARSWKHASPLRVVRDERTCPLLDGAGRCAVYAARPLGCRTFFCERADVAAPLSQRELNGLVRRIQDIAARHEPGGDRGRPLTRALGGM
jgi:Fe-S-cluster containining protein